VNKRRNFTPELKAKVALEVLSGAKSPAQVCRERDLKEQVVSRWKTELAQRAHEIFESDHQRSVEQERIAELERMVGRLTMELEIAKKVSNLWGWDSTRNGR
jgi:transposase-like protein